MEEPNCERSEGFAEEGRNNDSGGSPCPCSPELFAARWNRTLGPFRKKPFFNDNVLVDEIIRQEEGLLKFAKCCCIGSDRLLDLMNHRANRVAGGAEHEVFILDSRTRVWKATKKDRWGFKKDSPMDYLYRLQSLTNYAEPLEILVEGVAIRNGIPSIVTSMAYIHGHHPTPRQLAAKLKREGFALIPDDTGLLAYSHAESGMTIRDAHPGNFIVAAHGVYIPIDVAIEWAG